MAAPRRKQMQGKDSELKAIGSIISLLEPLSEDQRGRVLEYVLKRLEMAAVRTPATAPQSSASAAETASRPITDIRTLTAGKQPRSANEMTALVAYYVSEMAPESDRSDTVNADIIRRYFKMAGFPLPTALRSVLPNAAAAGYLQSVGRGEYRLNPVGYNLVVHRLPRSGSPGPASQATRRATRPKQRSVGRRGR